MGSMQTISYASQENPQIDGAAVVSHSYDCVASSRLLETGSRRKYLTPAIMKALCRTMDKNPFASPEEKAKCRKCRTLKEFDDAFTGPSRGYPDSKLYYTQMKLDTNIPRLKVPLLVLGAENDPFIRPEFLPKKEARESENVVLVHVKEGGHVSLLTGWKGRRSLIEEIIPDWIEAARAYKKSKQ
jgi:predicted alpha/beta-fold hydrolase